MLKPIRLSYGITGNTDIRNILMSIHSNIRLTAVSCMKPQIYKSNKDDRRQLTIRLTCRRGMRTLGCRDSQKLFGVCFNQQKSSFRGKIARALTPRRRLAQIRYVASPSLAGGANLQQRK
jgi:hypothetical protein